MVQLKKVFDCNLHREPQLLMRFDSEEYQSPVKCTAPRPVVSNVDELEVDLVSIDMLVPLPVSHSIEHDKEQARMNDEVR